MKVGERMAELIKINVGATLTEMENPPEDYIVHGPNQMTALPMEVPVSYQEISHCIEKSISKIEAAILSALENTPPELYADIVRNGIYLSGGGALLRGLDKRLTEKIGIKFIIADDPLHAVAKGTGIALKNINRFVPNSIATLTGKEEQPFPLFRFSKFALNREESDQFFHPPFLMDRIHVLCGRILLVVV